MARLSLVPSALSLGTAERISDISLKSKAKYFDLPSGTNFENISERFKLFSGFSFSSLAFDILLDYFQITPDQIHQNKQYWNRELGMCWQKLIIESVKDLPDYQPAFRIDRKEPCDLILGKDAIDTKYRIGSGGSGTIKKLKEYATLLSDMGYRPVLLILREDNLKSTLSACQKGGWNTIIGEKALEYIREKTGRNLI